MARAERSADGLDLGASPPSILVAHIIRNIGWATLRKEPAAVEVAYPD